MRVEIEVGLRPNIPRSGHHNRVICLLCFIDVAPWIAKALAELDAYGTRYDRPRGARDLLNMDPRPQGGVALRPGLAFYGRLRNVLTDIVLDDAVITAGGQATIGGLGDGGAPPPPDPPDYPDRGTRRFVCGTQRIPGGPSRRNSTSVSPSSSTLRISR